MKYIWMMLDKAADGFVIGFGFYFGLRVAIWIAGGP